MQLQWYGRGSQGWGRGGCGEEVSTGQANYSKWQEGWDGEEAGRGGGLATLQGTNRKLSHRWVSDLEFYYMCGVLLKLFITGYCLHLRLTSPLSSPEERSQQNLKSKFKQIKYVKTFHTGARFSVAIAIQVH